MLKHLHVQCLFNMVMQQDCNVQNTAIKLTSGLLIMVVNPICSYTGTFLFLQKNIWIWQLFNCLLCEAIENNDRVEDDNNRPVVWPCHYQTICDKTQKCDPVKLFPIVIDFSKFFWLWIFWPENIMGRCG